MEKDYKVYTIRRLFKEDIPLIEKCYSRYDFLHFNPLNTEYIEQTLLSGSFWGVFCTGQITALAYIQPAEKLPFSALNAAWEITDMLNCNLADYLLRGYIWTDKSCTQQELYSAFAKLWTIQAAHMGKKNILHYLPAHTEIDFRRLFRNGFLLAGLRGLDNIVPHYIFTAPAQLKKEPVKYRHTKTCPLSDTMTISMLCEHGYTGFGTDRQNNLLLGR